MPLARGRAEPDGEQSSWQAIRPGLRTSRHGGRRSRGPAGGGPSPDFNRQAAPAFPGKVRLSWAEGRGVLLHRFLRRTEPVERDPLSPPWYPPRVRGDSSPRAGAGTGCAGPGRGALFSELRWRLRPCWSVLGFPVCELLGQAQGQDRHTFRRSTRAQKWLLHPPHRDDGHKVHLPPAFQDVAALPFAETADPGWSYVSSQPRAHLVLRPKLLRRVGPEQVAQIGLRPPVEVTEARNATPTSPSVFAPTSSRCSTGTTTSLSTLPYW